MKQLTMIFALLFALPSLVAEEVPDKGALATKISEGRKQNMTMMMDYTWNTRTEIKVDGEVKSVKVDLVRYTADGKLQKTKISDSADGQKMPRGIRGRAAKKKKEEMQEWAGRLTELLRKYSLPTSGNVLDMLEKASVERTGQLAELTAANVVQSGDKMTMLVDTGSGQMKMVEIATALDGDAVSVEILNESIENGPTYSARQSVKVPAEKVELTIENFNFQEQ